MEEIIRRILRLWEDYYKGQDVFVPLLYTDLKTNALLFIGINPGVSKGDYSYSFKHRNEKLHEWIQKDHELKIKYPKYFGKFGKLGHEVGLERYYSYWN